MQREEVIVESKGGEGVNSPKDEKPKDKIAEENKPRRFLNGWSKEQERLMADWSDIASCYRWIHDQAEKVFKTKALLINSSVIIISSVAGFANIGVQSLFENNEQAIKYASFAIGGVSLLAGMLTTLNNLLKWSQQEEGNRVAAIAWGKFQRLVSVEMALHPNDRMDSLDFLKICRAELDRLIEQSPPIPKTIIHRFEKRFGAIKDLKKPDVCGALEHTAVYESSELRLKKLATDAVLMLRRKKDTLKELVTPEMEERIAKQVNERIEVAVEERKERLIKELEIQAEKERETQEIAKQVMDTRKAKIEEELEIQKRVIEEERRKMRETEQLMQQLLEERKRKIEEEMEFEKKRKVGESVEKSSDKFTGSSFENRLTMNKQLHSNQKHKSIRRKSIIAEGIYSLEVEENIHSEIRAPPSTPIIVSSGPKDEIIIITKE
jgi:hypothetical protein